MKHVGHTMATPELELPRAFELFSAAGCEAAEVVARTLVEQGTRHGPAAGEARILSPEWSAADLADLDRAARRAGTPILTVTPYVRTINSPDDAERVDAVRRLGEYIALAASLGAAFVRVYGGTDEYPPETLPLAAGSLGELADAAEPAGVTLLIENHPGTLTGTGEATARLIREVGRPGVRALYDPANVLEHSDEPWPETLAAQGGLIAYVHVKDFRIVAGRRVACPVGDGCVPWDRILPALVEAGYDGPLSYEYERKWHPDELPPADVGLARSIAHVRSVLAR